MTNKAERDVDNSNTFVAPTAEDVSRVLPRIGGLQHRRIFFERLQNPLWVRALDDAHAFDSSPDLETDEAGQVRLRPWPEGEYLTRMAPLASEEVARILLKHANTENPAVADYSSKRR